MPSSLTVPQAGNRYSLSCVAVENISGLTNHSHIQWTGPDGNAIENGNGVRVTELVQTPTTRSQTISFDSLRTSHAGQYSCMVTLMSPSLSTPFVVSQSQDLTVSGICFILCNDVHVL